MTQKSTNVPDNFYEEEKVHTGYNPNDRRDMQPLTPKTFDPVEVDTHPRDNQGKIITPKGREVDPQDPIRSLAKDLWEKLEQGEMERAQKAERREKGRRTGQLISDALKSLIDVYGENKGAHNTKRAPEKIDFAALDKLDADHASRLQRIRAGRGDDELAAARIKAAQEKQDAIEAGKDKDRELRANKYKFDEYKFPKELEEKEKDRKSREAIAKLRKPVPKPVKKEEMKDDTPSYNYSVPLKYRQSPNYTRMNPNAEGSVDIKQEHVARYANDFVNQYPEKANQLKKERFNLNTADPDYEAKLTRIQAEEARLLNIYDISKKLATGGGQWNSADVTTVLDEMMRPDNYIELVNQTPTRIEVTPPPKPMTATESVLQSLWGNPDLEKVRSMPKTSPLPQTPGSLTQATQEAPQEGRFINPDLNLKTNDPKRIKAAGELLEKDWVDTVHDKNLMRDKLTLHVGQLRKQYTQNYPLSNTSPIAKKEREKWERRMRDNIIQYWSNLDDGTIEKLEAAAEHQKTTIEELVSPIVKELLTGENIKLEDIF